MPTHGKRSPGLIAASLLLLTACGDAPRSGTGSSVIELVEELRIGTLDGADEEMFGSVSAVAPNDDGTVYVLDSRVPAIKRFDAAGSYAGTVGREGSGPGEYLRPSGLVPLAGGQLAVWDPGNARLSFFDADGEYRRGVSVPASLGGLTADTLGRFYVRTFLMEGWTPSDEEPDPPMGWIRLDSGGAMTDTVRVPAERIEGATSVVVTSDGLLRPFNRRTFSALGPGGEPLHAANDTYLVVRGTPDEPGDTLIDRRSEHEPVPIQGDERTQWESHARDVAARTGGSPARIPRVKPALVDVWTDRSGRLWVQRHVEAERIERDSPLAYREPPVYDLFAPDGQFLGTLALDRRVRLLDAHEDRVWTVELGEFDEEYVVVSRLREAG